MSVKSGAEYIIMYKEAIFFRSNCYGFGKIFVILSRLNKRFQNLHTILYRYNPNFYL